MWVLVLCNSVFFLLSFLPMPEAVHKKQSVSVSDSGRPSELLKISYLANGQGVPATAEGTVAAEATNVLISASGGGQGIQTDLCTPVTPLTEH